MTKVLVAMAACNGARYLDAQIESILSQLKENDSLYISLDPSTDGSKKRIKRWMEKDDRIRLFNGPGRGVVSNFESVLEQAKKSDADLIFLADQDDVWLAGKVERIKKEMQDPSVTMVITDASIVDGTLKPVSPSYFRFHHSARSFLSNLIRNSFIGTCMAFRRSLLDTALPFPAGVPMHDQWLGLMASTKGKVVWVDQPYLLYRRHGNNVSSLSHAPLPVMIKNRWVLIRSLGKRLFWKK